MLKMLNSLSSWPKAAPVSEAASLLLGAVVVLAFADDEGFEDAEEAVAVGGEVLQDVDRGAA